MPSHPVAALESRGKVLLAALGDRSGERVRVTTEDGRAFDYPADRLLWTARALRVEGESKREIGAALAVLRARAGPAPDWKALLGRAAAGVPLDPHEVAGGGKGAEADARALALAARAHEALPWFRIEGGRLVAATEAEVEAEGTKREEERRTREAEDALAAVLGERRPGVGSGGRSPLPPAAAPALASFLGWAMGPEESSPPALAKRLGLNDVFEATERLDAAGLLPADAIPPLSRRGIPREFSRKARDQATAAAGAGPGDAPREDLRALPAFALDDPGTFEVDDAISLLRGPGGEPHLLVHISDVAAAVIAEGALDHEIRRRAVTVYFPDTKVPMIPPDLTEGRLSLEEGRDRAAVTAEIRVGPDGAPEAVRVFRSLVRVVRRLDYHETREPAGLPEEIRPLFEAAQALRRARVAAGARVLDMPAAHLRVEAGVPALEIRAIGGAGDVLVGEAMIAFNRAAAGRLLAAGAAALWRTQEAPRGDLPPLDDPLFSLRARRLFAPVKVSLEPARHAGLGVDAYLQATSPIRRWSDLLHQRQLVALLEGRAPPFNTEQVREMAAELWQRERLVRTAESEREDYWMAVLLESRRGEEFEGFVARPVAHGRGHVWIPCLLDDFPFRWPRERGAAPPEGRPVRARIARLAKHRGRIEFEVA